MTIEEALNDCKRIREDIKSDIYLEYYNNTEELKKHHLDVIDTVIAALEKQIPKKVGHRTLRQTEWGSPWHCPECEADLVKVEFMSFDGGEPKNKVSYCWHCGSALAWSDKDE